MGKKGSKVGIVIGGLILLVIVVFGGLFLTQNLGKTDSQVNAEQSSATIEQMAKKVNPKTGNPKKSSLEYTDTEVTAEELPNLDDSSIATKATTPVFAEIYAAPNIAGKGTDAWLVEMADGFNNSKASVNGQQVSVQVRNVTSGLAVDYVTAGKDVPDALCPSNKLWVSMLQARNIPVETVSDSMVSDTRATFAWNFWKPAAASCESGLAAS